MPLLGLDPITMSPADVVVLHRANGRVVATEHHTQCDVDNSISGNRDYAAKRVTP